MICQSGPDGSVEKTYTFRVVVRCGWWDVSADPDLSCHHIPTQHSKRAVADEAMAMRESW